PRLNNPDNALHRNKPRRGFPTNGRTRHTMAPAVDQALSCKYGKEFPVRANRKLHASSPLLRSFRHTKYDARSYPAPSLSFIIQSENVHQKLSFISLGKENVDRNLNKRNNNNRPRER